MKKIILVIVLILGFTAFSQKELKCFNNNYKVVGELTYEKGKFKHYAGIKENIIYLTKVEMSGGEVSQVFIYTMPVDKVNLQVNKLFKSKSKTKTKSYPDYTELTLGSSFKDDSYPGTELQDSCFLKHKTSAVRKKRLQTIIGKFTDNITLFKLTDKIFEIQNK